MNRQKSLEVIFFQKILKTRNKYVIKKNWKQGYRNYSNAKRAVFLI